MRILVLFLLLLTARPSYAANIGTCTDLVDNLLHCKKYSCSVVEEKTNFITSYTVHGLLGGINRCFFTQTLPKNLLYSCKYDTEGYQAAARIIANKFDGITQLSKEDLSAIEKNVKEGYCNIINDQAN